MAQFKVADITESIISGVSKSLAKILLPRVRKMIREEMDRGMKDVMLEVIRSQRTTQVVESAPAQPASIKNAKETIAQRPSSSKQRARKIIERNGQSNDPLLDKVNLLGFVKSNNILNVCSKIVLIH